ncbi:MAG: hypothetical protein K6D02_01295 [Lachnospiraceae bacterium]|nr:hypothetical protein [Lachnospiraceae bacterium]
MFRAIILAIITTIGLIVFIALYINETRRVQTQYREQFITNLNHASDDIESYLNASGDKELRYRRIIYDMSSANSFCFLLEEVTEEQKIAVNELSTIIIKYPKQMNDEERLKAYKKAVDDIAKNYDKGYDEAKAVVKEIDKKGK